MRPPIGRDHAAALRHARRLLRAYPLIDGHNDLAWTIRNDTRAPGDVAAYDLRRRTRGHTDLARLRAGGVGGQFWSVYVPGDAGPEGFARLQLEQIDIARRVIARYPERLALCLTAAEVERARARGRVASLLGIEGGHAIENSLGALRAYHALGVRYMTLTHNVTTDWADAAVDIPRHGGLAPFGHEVVREMNRLGMLVDLAHVSPAVMDGALRTSAAPVIFSHSSCRALTDVPRNVPDVILARLPKNGGVIMLTFVAPFVSPEAAAARAAGLEEVRRRTAGVADRRARRRIEDEHFAAHPLPKATIEQVADHVEHARRLAGVEHLGVGADYDGNDHWPEGLEDTSRYPWLFAELVRRGWTDRDLAKLGRGNILRVLRAAEATARRLQARRPSSRATLEDAVGPSPKA
ncbi:MAG: dipeptidase [Candidatus Rokuibacteriota bacterium]